MLKRNVSNVESTTPIRTPSTYRDAAVDGEYTAYILGNGARISHMRSFREYETSDTFVTMMPCVYVVKYTEPSKQFLLVEEHITGLRRNLYRSLSKVRIYVERNLGFEAEHHKRALDTIEGVEFYQDHKAGRVGVLTTNDTKHAMSTVLNTMLRERRVHVHPELHGRDPKGTITRLKEQMEIYSYQFKQATNTFGTDRVALSGKVGGMKDDLCICLQLGVYWTSVHVAQAAFQS